MGSRSPAPGRPPLGLSRRTVLGGFAALASANLVGCARRPRTRFEVPRSDPEAGIFHVADFGARGDYDFRARRGTDDTAAINAAIAAAHDHGGGLVVFDGARTYRLTDPKRARPDELGGPSIRLRPGVSLDGHGCRLYQADKAICIGNEPDIAREAAVTGDVGPGARAVTVDRPQMFAPGDRVFLRLGDNPYQPGEPRVTALARVTTIEGPILRLDRTIRTGMNAATTSPENRRVLRLASLIEDIGIRNFRFRSPPDVSPESGLRLQLAHRVVAENLWADGNIGAGIVVAQWAENCRFTHLNVRRNANPSRQASMGRAITLSNATDCTVDHIVGNDLDSVFSFVESYSRGIEFRHLWIDYPNNPAGLRVLFTGAGSEATYRDVYIRARRPIVVHDRGGSLARYQFRNLTVSARSYPKALPSPRRVSGLLRLIVENREFAFDLDRPETIETTVPLENGIYANTRFPPGLILRYETWLSPGASPAALRGVYLGSESNNGIDIKDQFTPGRWHSEFPLQGPGADYNPYGSVRRLSEMRKLLVVTAARGVTPGSGVLRLRLHIAPLRTGLSFSG